jgi:hypothetical protein
MHREVQDKHYVVVNCFQKCQFIYRVKKMPEVLFAKNKKGREVLKSYGAQK